MIAYQPCFRTKNWSLVATHLVIVVVVLLLVVGRRSPKKA